MSNATGVSSQTSAGYQPLLRIQSQQQSTQESLKLEVRTREGDTVELSIDASSLAQFAQGSENTQNGSVSASSASETDKLSVKVKIKGNLNSQELSDIKSVLESLTTGQPIDSSLSSLRSYHGSFQETSSTQNSWLGLYA